MENIISFTPPDIMHSSQNHQFLSVLEDFFSPVIGYVESFHGFIRWNFLNWNSYLPSLDSRTRCRNVGGASKSFGAASWHCNWKHFVAQ